MVIDRDREFVKYYEPDENEKFDHVVEFDIYKVP